MFGRGLGAIAQEGQGSVPVAPTGVSIATSSSGDYDGAFIVSDASGCSMSAMDVTGAFWSSNAKSTNPDVGEFSAYQGCSAQSYNKFYAYLRATGATSFAWDLELTSQSLSNSNVADVAGTVSTNQDCTSTGVGEYLRITFGGGRGGQLYPVHGDSIVVTLKATATNSVGGTDATDCVLTYNFI